MHYLIEPKYIIYVKDYFHHLQKTGKMLAINIVKKLLDSAKTSGRDAIKTASKRATKKTSEATGDLIGKKIADKITSVSKKIFTNYFKDR